MLATDEKFRKIMSKYETEGRSEVIDNNGYIHIWNVELEANDKDVCYMVNALTLNICLCNQGDFPLGFF